MNSPDDRRWHRWRNRVNTIKNNNHKFTTMNGFPVSVQRQCVRGERWDLRHEHTMENGFSLACMCVHDHLRHPIIIKSICSRSLLVRCKSIKYSICATNGDDANPHHSALTWQMCFRMQGISERAGNSIQIQWRCALCCARACVALWILILNLIPEIKCRIHRIIVIFFLAFHCMSGATHSTLSLK